MQTAANFYRAFGRHIRELRKQRGMSQAQLAEAIDVSPLTVSNIERGVNPPSFQRIEMLANALGVDVHELFLFPEAML